MKLTEDEIVIFVIKYLKKQGWTIIDYKLGQNRGIDIEATKGKEQLFVEAKGARAGDNSPTKKRTHFDSGQIKDHFGKAIVKMLAEKNRNPKVKLVIAHPDDNDVKRNIGHLTPYLRKLNIKHFWVSENGSVTEE